MIIEKIQRIYKDKTQKLQYHINFFVQVIIYLGGGFIFPPTAFPSNQLRSRYRLFTTCPLHLTSLSDLTIQPFVWYFKQYGKKCNLTVQSNRYIHIHTMYSYIHVDEYSRPVCLHLDFRYSSNYFCFKSKLGLCTYGSKKQKSIGLIQKPCDIEFIIRYNFPSSLVFLLTICFFILSFSAGFTFLC